MASLNRVLIMGHLGQDPELRYTASQVPVATLNVATTERWLGKDGQQQESTEWHRIVVWGKQAENTAKYLAKGRAVFVEGRLQTRSWEDKNGQKRYTTEINASTVQFLNTGAAGAERGAGNYNSFQNGRDMAAVSPSASHFPQADHHQGQASIHDGLDDLSDIPF